MGMGHVKEDRFEKAPQGKDRLLECRSKECSRDGESAVGVGEPKMFSSDFSIRFQIALWEKGEQKGCGWDTWPRDLKERHRG